jgi:hypothetical protein
MVTFLITSVVILGLIAIAIYFWQKPGSRPEPVELPPPRAAGLFAEEAQTEIAEPEEASLLTTDLTEQHESEAELAAKLEELNGFIQTWRESPDKRSTATMLHLAASTDDADTYCQVVELALNFWRRGGIPDLSAVELQTLLNSEYWLLSSRTRSSGAGFVLKRTLSQAKRELETTNNNQPN